MEQDFTQQQNYIRAKKRVKDIKGFYVHFTVYIIINIFISGVIIYGLMSSGDSFLDAIQNFGTISTWIFWGIGIIFHWLGVFGFKSIGFGKDWEERKIRELMDKEDEMSNKLNRRN